MGIILASQSASQFFYSMFTRASATIASYWQVCFRMRKIIIFLTPIVVLLALALMAGNKGDTEQGKKVFEQCAVCHNADTDEKKVGPSLKGLFQRKKLKNGKSLSDENVVAVINSGGGGMPSFADTLSQEEKDNLLAYLHSI
jgi:cytochrome c